MPRRPPPTALRLATGPTPPRHYAKHVLPSIPLPTFYPSPAQQPDYLQAPASRKAIELRQIIAHTELVRTELPPLNIPFIPGHRRSSSGADGTNPASAGSFRDRRGQMLRGPWDHSGCISVGFDVESVLAPLKPVVVSPGAGYGSTP